MNISQSNIVSPSLSNAVASSATSSTIIVLIKPLSSRIGLPSKEIIDKIFDMRYRLVILDPEINRKLANSAKQNPRFKGYELSDILKEEAKLNPLLYMIPERSCYWNYKLGEGTQGSDDIRTFDSKVVYIDCSRNMGGSLSTPNYISDTMFTMSLVEDFKVVNRAYYRIEANQINSILDLANKDQDLYNVFSGDPLRGFNPQASLIDIKVMIEALYYYLKNGFHEEDKEIPLYMCDVDIYNQPGNPNWCMNMNTPVLKGIVTYYGILPDVPEDDRRALISTGKTPTTTMATNSQYRRIVTDTLLKVLSNFVVNNKMHSGKVNDTSLDWYDYNLWGDILESI